MKPTSWHQDEQIIDRRHLDGVDYHTYVVGGLFDNGTPIVITCWKLSFKDLIRIVFSRKVFVSLLTDGDLPPIGVCSDLEDIGADRVKHRMKK
jgi:hypothetical protein